MTIQTALDIKAALILLSETLHQDFNKTASNICLFDNEKFEILKEASKLWNEFQAADIVERGKMLGLKIKTLDENSYETEIILSEGANND